jgi:hypothetical protein
MSNRRLALFLLTIASPALGCNPVALKANMDWAKQNSSTYAAIVQQDCPALQANPDDPIRGGEIFQWFKAAESHNDDAAATIDLCPQRTFVQLACN